MKESFEKFAELIEELRLKCPWDAEQTLDSLKATVLEEAQEVVDAIDAKDWENLREELGDLLCNIMLMAQIAKEEGLFHGKEMIEEAHKKQVRRHPHVYGEEKAETAEQAIEKWREIKAKEKKKKP